MIWRHCGVKDICIETVYVTISYADAWDTECDIILTVPFSENGTVRGKEQRSIELFFSGFIVTFLINLEMYLDIL